MAAPKRFLIGLVCMTTTSLNAQVTQWQYGTGTAYFTAGNVGIGTQTPTAPLHIVNNNNVRSITLEGNSAGWGSGIVFKNTASQGKSYGIYTSPLGNWHFSDNDAGADRMIINNIGNIGITGNISHDLNDNFTYEGRSFGHYAFGWGADSWDNSSQNLPPTAWLSAYGGMKFFTSGQVKMSIDINGNVGIGTSRPKERFQLGDRWVFQDGGWKGILNNATWDNSLGKNKRIISAPVSGIFFTDKGNTTFINAPNNVEGSTVDDAAYGMTIYSSGQVGVGTSYNISSFPDLSYKLHVEGGVRARKVKVDQSSWADYVFHANYRLRPLSEVEQYIKQYGHLPEVPTAEEVAKNGLDVGDNQATLLKKIEELTLYVIEQQKEIKALKKEMEDLKDTRK
jgi:hypothetical protein